MHARLSAVILRKEREKENEREGLWVRQTRGYVYVMAPVLIKIQVVRVTRCDMVVAGVFGRRYAHVRPPTYSVPAALYFVMHVKKSSRHTRKS